MASALPLSITWLLIVSGSAHGCILLVKWSAAMYVFLFSTLILEWQAVSIPQFHV